jgi:hypothetical protein
MQNNLDPRDGLEPVAPRTPKDAPLAEQELAPTGRISAAVQAWLDGEPVAEGALSAAPRDVAFWTKVEAETTVRRRMTTPAHVPAQILAKLGEQR